MEYASRRLKSELRRVRRHGEACGANFHALARREALVRALARLCRPCLRKSVPVSFPGLHWVLLCIWLRQCCQHK